MTVVTKKTFVLLALVLGAIATVTMLAPAAASAQVPVETICIGLGGTFENNLCTFTENLICEVFAEAGPAWALLGLDIPVCDGDNETDYCSTVDGIQDEEYNCPSQAELDCENAGGTWNDENSTCTPADNGGGGGNETPTDTEEESSGGGGGGNNGGGGGGSRNRSNGGEVAGASTDSCGVLLTGYVGLGKANNLVDVVRLQLFLNTEMDANLPVNGVYDLAAKAVVDQFQLKYSDEVLAPWVPFGLPTEKTPTGYVYKTTQRMINNINCDTLNIPMPLLP